MTIHLGNDTRRSQAKLSSRPERSVVEGSAVRPSDFPNSSWVRRAQDDEFVGVLTKNIPNKLALVGRSPS
jgi:hypothetical protein